MIIAGATLLIQAAGGLRDCERRALQPVAYSVGGSRTAIQVDVKNTGEVACLLGALPDIRVSDRDGRVVKLRRRNPYDAGPHVSLGHGPVVIPLTIPPGGSATTTLTLDDVSAHRSVSCPRPVFLALTWSFTVSATLQGAVCYADDGGAQFEQPMLTLRPAPTR